MLDATDLERIKNIVREEIADVMKPEVKPEPEKISKVKAGKKEAKKND